MIRLSVFYPKGDGKRFDYDYYRDKHVPLAVSLWRPVKAEVDKGLNGPYEAAVHFVFNSPDELQAALGNPDTAKVQADMANYTDITPVMQTSSIEG